MGLGNGKWPSRHKPLLRRPHPHAPWTWEGKHGWPEDAAKNSWISTSDRFSVGPCHITGGGGCPSRLAPASGNWRVCVNRTNPSTLGGGEAKNLPVTLKNLVAIPWPRNGNGGVTKIDCKPPKIYMSPGFTFGWGFKTLGRGLYFKAFLPPELLLRETVSAFSACCEEDSFGPKQCGFGREIRLRQGSQSAPPHTQRTHRTENQTTKSEIKTEI